MRRDRKSTRLNSSHTVISYAVFCLKKKKTDEKLISKKNKFNQQNTNHCSQVMVSFGCVIDSFQIQAITSPSAYIEILFFFNDTATTEIYTLSLHDALPI